MKSNGPSLVPRNSRSSMRWVSVDHIVPASHLSKWVTVVPRRNRLRIYIDGPDKYYKLRELRRALPEVVVKVSNGDRRPIAVDGLMFPSGSPEHPQGDYQYQDRERSPWKEGG